MQSSIKINKKENRTIKIIGKAVNIQFRGKYSHRTQRLEKKQFKINCVKNSKDQRKIHRETHTHIYTQTQTDRQTDRKPNRQNQLKLETKC